MLLKQIMTILVNLTTSFADSELLVPRTKVATNYSNVQTPRYNKLNHNLTQVHGIFYGQLLRSAGCRNKKLKRT